MSLPDGHPIQPQLKPNKTHSATEWITAAVALVIVYWLFQGCPGIPENPTRGKAILRTDSGTTVWLAATEDAWDRLTQLSTAGDDVGIQQMFIAKLAWSIPNNTKVRVIDPGVFCVEVRILEGSHSGRSGFTAAEFVR